MLVAEPPNRSAPAVLPGWENPLATLRRNWGEIPGGEQHTL